MANIYYHLLPTLCSSDNWILLDRIIASNLCGFSVQQKLFFLFGVLPLINWSLQISEPGVLPLINSWCWRCVQEVAPLTSGRLSHSSGPLTGGGSITDSPPVSPEIDDAKVHCLSPFLCNTVLLQSFLLLPHVTCVLLQHFQYFGCNFQCLH